MSQREEIFDHLKRKGSIDSMIALQRYGCFRLAARIDELRTQGHDIQTETVTRGKKHYARYRYHAHG